MTGQSTTRRATFSKQTSPKTESTPSLDEYLPTAEPTSSESCPEDLGKTLYAQSLVRYGPRLRQLFRSVSVALTKYELQVVSGLSDGTSLNDYDEAVMAKYRLCESLLAEIELRLSLLSHQARHRSLFVEEKSVEELLDMKLRPNFKSESH